jgi:hypothetical protein
VRPYVQTPVQNKHKKQTEHRLTAEKCVQHCDISYKTSSGFPDACNCIRDMELIHQKFQDYTPVILASREVEFGRKVV